VYIPDESLANLYHTLSGHPLLNPEIASRGLAGESAGQLSTACLAVTEALMLDRETSSVELRQLRTTEIPRLEGEVASLKAELGSVRDANRGLEDANRGLEDANRSLEDANRSLEDANRGLEDANRGLEEELVSLRNSRVLRWSRPVRRFYHQIVRH
jgi:septal ring factor EnvC (AmiA/AmiB activator)